MHLYTVPYYLGRGDDDAPSNVKDCTRTWDMVVDGIFVKENLSHEKLITRLVLWEVQSQLHSETWSEPWKKSTCPFSQPFILHTFCIPVTTPIWAWWAVQVRRSSPYNPRLSWDYPSTCLDSLFTWKLQQHLPAPIISIDEQLCYNVFHLKQWKLWAGEVAQCE